MGKRIRLSNCVINALVLLLVSNTGKSIHEQLRPSAEPQKIEHVVLLMLENRAFDHMCGFFPHVNGLKGNETNPLNTSQPNKEKVTVQSSSPFIRPIDPAHSTPATTSKIFGEACLKKNPPCNEPTMDGFIEYSLAHGNSLNDASTLMNAFTPERLPIMSTLAKEFAIFDKFDASVPGPTWPNRLFQLMGTSKGCTETNKFNPHTFLYFGKTILGLGIGSYSRLSRGVGGGTYLSKIGRTEQVVCERP